MIQLVLLPVYGSWLSKDFAAVQPSHKHIFLNNVVLDHHQPGGRHLVAHDDAAEFEGVVNIPDQDAAGMGLLMLLFLSAATIILPDGRNGLQFVLSTFYTLLNGLFPHPLEQPPRI